jgi:hypothetical protein
MRVFCAAALMLAAMAAPAAAQITSADNIVVHVGAHTRIADTYREHKPRLAPRPRIGIVLESMRDPNARLRTIVGIDYVPAIAFNRVTCMIPDGSSEADFDPCTEQPAESGRLFSGLAGADYFVGKWYGQLAIVLSHFKRLDESRLAPGTRLGVGREINTSAFPLRIDLTESISRPDKRLRHDVALSIGVVF